MTENTNNGNIKYLKLDTIDDVKSLVCDILSECNEPGMLKENSGRMVALLHVWLKACSLGVEYEEIRDIKARLKVLEEAKQ
jgi:hypothetical protein